MSRSELCPLCDRMPTTVQPENGKVNILDIAHLNLLTWNLENLDSLSENLKNRIVRVLGKGPVVSPD